jgi:hypothetical protein
MVFEMKSYWMYRHNPFHHLSTDEEYQWLHDNLQCMPAWPTALWGQWPMMCKYRCTNYQSEGLSNTEDWKEMWFSLYKEYSEVALTLELLLQYCFWLTMTEHSFPALNNLKNCVYMTLYKGIWWAETAVTALTHIRGLQVWTKGEVMK